MATLTVLDLSSNRTDQEITLVAADAAGDKFVNTGVEYVMVSNTGLSSCVLTVSTDVVTDGIILADKTITLAAGEKYVLGPWPTATYNDSDNYVNLSYADETDIEVQALKFGRTS